MEVVASASITRSSHAGFPCAGACNRATSSRRPPLTAPGGSAQSPAQLPLPPMSSAYSTMRKFRERGGRERGGERRSYGRSARRAVAGERMRDSKPFLFTLTALCGVIPGVVGYGVMQLTSSRNDKLEAHLRSNALPETTV